MPVHGYLVGIERMVEIADDMMPLILTHWKEVDQPWRGGEPRIDYARYCRIERHGELAAVTARHRDSGRLVGYYVLFFDRDLHTEGRTASEAGLYLAQGHRSFPLFHQMNLFAERLVDTQGCKTLVVMADARQEEASGKKSSLGRYLGRRGYQPVRTMYARTTKPG